MRKDTKKPSMGHLKASQFQNGKEVFQVLELKPMKTSFRQSQDLPIPSSLITVSTRTIKTSIKPDGQRVLPVSKCVSWNVRPELNVVPWNGTTAGGMDQNAIYSLLDGEQTRL